MRSTGTVAEVRDPRMVREAGFGNGCGARKGPPPGHGLWRERDGRMCRSRWAPMLWARESGRCLDDDDFDPVAAGATEASERRITPHIAGHACGFSLRSQRKWCSKWVVNSFLP